MEKDRGEGESLHSRSTTSQLPINSDALTVKHSVKESEASKSFVTIKPLTATDTPWVNKYVEPSHVCCTQSHPGEHYVEDPDKCKLYETDEEKSNIDYETGPKYPPGLEMICDTEAIVIRPAKEDLEVFSGYRGHRKFEILDSFGKPMYYGIESSGCFSNACFHRSRSFKITVVDKTGSEILIVQRISKFCGVLCASCCSEVYVNLGNGFSMGKVSQRCGGSGCPSYTVTNSKLVESYLIKPISKCCFRHKPKFYVQAKGDHDNIVGELTKDWGGLGRETLKPPREFGMSFPRHLDAYDKTLLMAVVILVDAIYS